MRHLIWVAVLAAFTQMPMAYAQSRDGDDTHRANSSSVRAERNDGENCGTPDEFRRCPPLPRRNLMYYRDDHDRR